VKKKVEIRVGGNFDRDVADYIDNPRKLGRQPDKVIYVKDFPMLASIFSRKKLELLDSISGNQSVSALANKLSRKQEAVSRDIRQLETAGLVKVRRVGNRSIAEKVAAKIVVRV